MSDNKTNVLDRKTCVCCLSTKRSLIKLGKCKHGFIFANIFENMVNYAEMYVCSFCHQFVIKIEKFIRQVEKSFYLLNNKYEESVNKTTNNFEMSAIEINYAIKNEVLQHEFVDLPLDIDVKPIIKTEQLNISESEDNYSFSEDETTLPMNINITKIEPKEVKILNMEGNSKTKNVKKRFEDVKTLLAKKKNMKKAKTHTISKILEDNEIKLNDKIKIITLSQDEIIGERNWAAMHENYIKKQFKCEDCIIGFTHKHIYELHLKDKHESSKGAVMCEICKCCLNNDIELQNHMRQHVIRYQCKECGVRKGDRYTAIFHYQTHHEFIQMIFTCEQCGLTADSYKQHRAHINTHRERVPCQVCGGTFASQNVLTKHIFKMHGPPDPVSCPTCDKKFKTDIQLKRHMYIHETPEPSADKFCDTCKIYFRSRTFLKLHLKNHSKHIKDADKRFKCYECGVKYVEKARLKDHFDWVHLKLRNYVCTVCSKEFETKRCMTRHTMYVHEKIKRPKNKICDLCGKGFSSLRVLQSHIRTHTGERPYKCGLCDKTFGFHGALYTHNKLVHKKIKRKAYPKKKEFDTIPA